MRPKSVGKLMVLASAAAMLFGGVTTSSAHAQASDGPIVYSITFSNPRESDDNDLPEPYGEVFVRAPWGQQTELWKHPDLDINTPTLPRYPESGATHRFVPHPVSEVCASVGEDDTGINEDDVLADGCLPYTGPGDYTLSAEGGSVTVSIYHFG
ncbi:hypothetical protein VSR01_11275 [Actinacidiphila sp. DG2A-62]|uniref:hypothetical protein n=1 Tax=Actinacidiphila sp. DG2A-62 TaxID=3108821 RepID=UPI002DB70357|nr:hypothetical protein [Actinacidiphila sp. DG2A-62]MEC3994096.1 hypothetical protein [Actinacidiphila sp. DG2A-62]